LEEGAERLSLPYEERESGKGAKLRGKVNAVFLSEEGAASASLLHQATSEHLLDCWDRIAGIYRQSDIYPYTYNQPVIAVQFAIASLLSLVGLAPIFASGVFKESL